MSNDSDIIVHAGEAFHCPEGHYVCRAARDIPNEPETRMRAADFADWAPGVNLGGPTVPMCPTCGKPWMFFNKGGSNASS